MSKNKRISYFQRTSGFFPEARRHVPRPVVDGHHLDGAPPSPARKTPEQKALEFQREFSAMTKGEVDALAADFAEMRAVDEVCSVEMLLEEEVAGRRGQYEIVVECSRTGHRTTHSGVVGESLRLEVGSHVDLDLRFFSDEA